MLSAAKNLASGCTQILRCAQHDSFPRRCLSQNTSQCKLWLDRGGRDTHQGCRYWECKVGRDSAWLMAFMRAGERPDGRVKQKQLPWPGMPRLSAQMRPPIDSTICLLI